MKMLNFRKRGASEAEAVELPTAGCGSLDYDEALAIQQSFFEEEEDWDDVEDAFYAGFFSGLQFVSMYEEAETYGENARAFAENAFCYVLRDQYKKSLLDAAVAALDLLDLMDEEEGERS